MPEDLFRPKLGKPHHYAYLVEDIEATVNRLVDQLGAGPFFLIEGVPLENVLSRGEPAEFAHNSAFGHCGDGPIELMEPPAPARARRAGLFRSPAGDPPRRLRRAASGRGRFAKLAGPARSDAYLNAQLGEVDMTFHDASATLGHDIEIHVDSQGLRDSFKMVRDGAEGWDGSEPLRPVAS